MNTRSDTQMKFPLSDRSRKTRSIELHIGELVLHGFSHSDRRPIAESLELELRTLLLREGFSNPTAFQIDQLNGEPFQLERTQRAESAGTNIARTIYGGLRR